MKRLLPVVLLSFAATAAVAGVGEFTVPADKKIKLGPLTLGRYPFVEEYHENDAAAQGTIIVE